MIEEFSIKILYDINKEIIRIKNKTKKEKSFKLKNELMNVIYDFQKFTDFLIELNNLEKYKEFMLSLTGLSNDKIRSYLYALQIK